MGRFLNHLNTVLNVVFIASAAGVVILAVLSLVKGPTLRYAPYAFALGAVYYLAESVKIFSEDGRRGVLRGGIRLLIVCALAVLTFVAYRCLG